MVDYAELHCVSNFSFLRGASHPEELVERARALGYRALAITDECSLAGVVRAHLRARELSLPLIIGAEFALPALTDPAAADLPGFRLVLLATDRDGYGNLSELISTARMRATKGRYRLIETDLEHGIAGCLALLIPPPAAAICDPGPFAATARWLRERFDQNGRIGIGLHARGHDAALLAAARDAAGQSGLALVAAGDVHCHLRSRKPLQDVLTAIRLGVPVGQLGRALAPNAEQHLRSRLRLARLYPEELLAESLVLAERCRFSLDSLRYEYPDEIVPSGETPASWLRTLTLRGAAGRYPDGLPDTLERQIDHELALIAELHYEPYFLTVADIVAFARSRGILCQGRGSAANSAVCYCLGVTEVDPGRGNLLFERFISRERAEPPDIDVDFEHQRREEVIRYVYDKYGRERAALAATVIRYRSRSALRDVGKALGIDARSITALARSRQWWERSLQPRALSDAGLSPDSRTARLWLSLAATLHDFPRHLSQHTGGFVIARDRLTRLVPVENAAMPGRSVIEWDKDDLEAMGLLKVDVLALGMLTAIRRSLDFISARRGRPFRMQDIPHEDPAVYEMLSKGDAIGVFQVESRAQMSMLPRLKPQRYYDLVIEVAIVRPGPIQGGMVHPYLRRRQGLEPVVFPREEIRPALERTLGVPIFQEQVMQIAMLAAGFSAGEADALRRAMAAWRRRGDLGGFRERLIEGMTRRGYEAAFAEAIFRQIQGFGEYGFPESHAASFALLVYVSAWIKCHEPAAFLAGLLDSQPMGFYAPAQLVRDARAHGVEVLGVDVLDSDWGCTLEARGQSQPAVRLGLQQVRGLSRSAGERLLAARKARRRQRPEHPAFDDTDDLARAAGLDAHALRCLADANALVALAGHRRQAAWEVAAVASAPALLADAPVHEPRTKLAAPSDGEDTVADYRSLGIPMGRHPLELLRPRLARWSLETAAALLRMPDRRTVMAAGLVTHRQRPETAGGTLFVTLEDETGAIDLIVRPRVFERHRNALLSARLLRVRGMLQRSNDGAGSIAQLIAWQLFDDSALLGSLVTVSRDFR
ncbi:MAG: error-prone DNA polymerase [Burkholderiaceae bacterium]